MQEMGEYAEKMGERRRRRTKEDILQYIKYIYMNLYRRGGRIFLPFSLTPSHA